MCSTASKPVQGFASRRSGKGQVELAIMHHPISRGLVFGLVALLLGLSALTYPVTVPHELHHAHHQSATHSNPLCSWLCEAGQVAGDTAPLHDIAFIPVANAAEVRIADPATLILFARLSRGPPQFVS